MLNAAHGAESDGKPFPLQQSSYVEQARGVDAALRDAFGVKQVGTRKPDRQLDFALVTPSPRHQRERVAGDQNPVGLPEGTAHQGIERHQKIGQVAQPLPATLTGRESGAKARGNTFAAGDRAQQKRNA